jgi:hypothetical protein
MDNRYKRVANKKSNKTILCLFILGFAALGVLATLLGRAETPPTVYYVAPSGNDTNPGTQDKPFASVTRAAVLASGGETIMVASGEYQPLTLNKTYSSPVMIRGYGTTKPRFHPLHFFDNTKTGYGNNISIHVAGAQNVTMDNIASDGWVEVRNNVSVAERVARNIILKNSDLTNTDERRMTMTVRSGAENIIIENNYFHDAWSGLTGPNVDGGPNVKNIVIRHNTMHRFINDALQFTDWDDVTIEGNDMGYVEDPAHIAHNDIIQFAGNSRRVKIINNKLHHTHSQIIFIQPAFGAIDDVLIQNNLIYSPSGGRLISNEGNTNVRVISNTIWCETCDAGMIIRPQNGFTPHDTIVVNNILKSLGYIDGATAGYENNNLFSRVSTSVTPGPQSRVGVDPKFVSIVNEDYRPANDSPAINAGHTEYAPATDREGKPRVGLPDIGAFEYQGAASTPTSPRAGDLNGDGKVNGLDLSMVVSRLNTSDLKGDANKDSKVNGLDISYVVSRYGQ